MHFLFIETLQEISGFVLVFVLNFLNAVKYRLQFLLWLMKHLKLVFQASHLKRLISRVHHRDQIAVRKRVCGKEIINHREK